MRKSLEKLKFFAIVSTVFFALSAYGFSVNAQEAAADGSGDQAAATPLPVAAPTPIPLSDVVSSAEAAAAKLRDVRASQTDAPEIREIRESLPELKNDLDARATETNQLLSARPSLETLRTTEQSWQSLTKNIAAWKENLKTQIVALDRQLAELKTLGETWRKTAESLTQAETPARENANISANGNANISANGNANSSAAENIVIKSDVPPEILQKIRATIAAIKQTQTLLEEKRGQLLTLQTRISEQETLINDTLAAIREVREEALTHLFVKDSPAIWNAQKRSDSAGRMFTEAGGSYAAQFAALSEYAKRQTGGFILHAIIFLLLFAALVWARRRIRPLLEADAELEPAFSVFQLPIAAALILSIMLSGWFYPQAPRILSSILGAAAIIPGIIYLRRILERPLFPVLNALVIFYFIDQIRLITATLPLLSRILFLAEMTGAIIFLVWFLRSKNLSNKIEVRHQQIFTIVKKAIPFFLGLFAVAFIANLLGYVSLSNVVGNSVLSSAYIALILYAAVQIVKSLLVFAFRVRPLSDLGIIGNYRPTIQAKVFRIINWIGLIAWFLLTLNLFSVRETVFGYFKDWLTAELVLGSIAISLSDVIIFVFTIWLAFAISRFVRFVLQEDIYPRVHLAGGVPYAVSTMLHYVILVAGFVLAIAALGFDLTKFTILAGAFGVGLGFGMQTIVNNFVSGLILLFERPVKVGDTVQLGEHQGDLNGIGLRASVLRKVDGSEVIVPNSKLISEEVINWTLSDQQRRIDINVGVAYGSEPEHVIELLTKIASAHEQILKTPPPRTLFVGFGENSLDFQLRAWTDDTERWIFIRSELAVGVHNILGEENIEIPFPQRDLNLKLVSPEAAKIIKNGSLKQGSSSDKKDDLKM